MQIYTITREEIEQYKRDNDNHGLPDNLDLLVAAVLYDREVGEPEFAATGIRWIDAEMCDAQDNVIDTTDVPDNTLFWLIHKQKKRKDFDRRRDDRLRRMGAL